MKPTKRLRGICTECGCPIEFPAEMIGSTGQCLRCGKQTPLLLAPPPAEPALPRKVVIWTAITVVILIFGAILLVVGFNRLKTLAERQKNKAAPAQTAKPTNALPSSRR